MLIMLSLSCTNEEPLVSLSLGTAGAAAGYLNFGFLCSHLLCDTSSFH